MSKSNEIGDSQKSDIEPVKPGQIQIISHARDIHMYYLTDTEIDELCSEHSPTELGLFTLCLGLLIAFIIALVTAQMSNRAFAAFIALASTSLLATLYFGCKTLGIKRQLKQRAEQIKKSRQI